MRKRISALILIIANGAVNAATGNLSIVFDLNRPLVLTLNQQPSFGVLAMDQSYNSNVTVSLDPSSGLVTSTATGVSPQTGSGAQFGILSVTGQSGKNIAVVQFPSTIILSNGTSSLNLNVTTSPASSTLNTCLISQTNCSLKLGGSMTFVPASVTTGSYSGTANITLRYVN